MKYMLSAMPLNASLPPSLQMWLGQELEMRGIDAVIYTRYILSIFLQESADWDPLDSEDLTMPRSGAGWKAKGHTKKVLRKKTAADIEELKKTAAVECLLSVSEEDTGIKKLVDELYSKLKEQETLEVPDEGAKYHSSEGELTASDGETQADPVERYHQAFPALSGSDDEQSTDIVSVDHPKSKDAWAKIVSKAPKRTYKKDSRSEERGTDKYGLCTDAKAKRGIYTKQYDICCANIENEVIASPEKACQGEYSFEKVWQKHYLASNPMPSRILSWPDLHPARPCYFDQHGQSDDHDGEGERKQESDQTVEILAEADGSKCHNQVETPGEEISEDLPSDGLEDLSWYTEPIVSLFTTSPGTSRRLYRRNSLEDTMEPGMLAEMMQKNLKINDVISVEDGSPDIFDILECNNNDKMQDSKQLFEIMECNNNLLTVPDSDGKSGYCSMEEETPVIDAYQLFKPACNETNKQLCVDNGYYSEIFGEEGHIYPSQSPDLSWQEVVDPKASFYLGTPDLFSMSRPSSGPWFSSCEQSPTEENILNDLTEHLGAASLFSDFPGEVKDCSCSNCDQSLVDWKQWSDYSSFGECYQHLKQDWCNYSSALQTSSLLQSDPIWTYKSVEIISPDFPSPSPDGSIWDTVRTHLSPHRDKAWTCHLWDINMQWKPDMYERPSTLEQIRHYMISLSITIGQPCTPAQEDTGFLQGGVYGGEMAATAYDETWKQKLGLTAFSGNNNCWVFTEKLTCQDYSLPLKEEEIEELLPVNHDIENIAASIPLKKPAKTQKSNELVPSENSAFQPSTPSSKLYQTKSDPCLLGTPSLPLHKISPTCRFVQVKYLYKSEPHILQQLGLVDEDPLNRQACLNNMTFSHNTHFKPIHIDLESSRLEQPQPPVKASRETDHLTQMQQTAAEASTASRLSPNTAKDYQPYWVCEKDKGPSEFVPKFKVEIAREKYAQTGDSLDLDDLPAECKETEDASDETKVELDHTEHNLELEESTWAMTEDMDGDITPLISDGAVDPTVEWLFADIDKVREEGTSLLEEPEVTSDFDSFNDDSLRGSLSVLWSTGDVEKKSIWSIDGHCNPIWNYAGDGSAENCTFSWPGLDGTYPDWSSGDKVRTPVQEDDSDQLQGAVGGQAEEEVPTEWAYLYDEVFIEEEDEQIQAKPSSSDPEPKELPSVLLDLERPQLPMDEAMFSTDLEEQWLQDVTSFDISAQKTEHHRIGPSRKPCSFFLEGNCRRKDCKFAHDMSQITCRFWEQGDCFKGVTCPFLHGYQGQRVADKTKAKAQSKNDNFSLVQEEFPELGRKVNSDSHPACKEKDLKSKKALKKEHLRKSKESFLTYRRYAKKNKSRAKSLPTDIKTNRG